MQKVDLEWVFTMVIVFALLPAQSSRSAIMMMSSDVYQNNYSHNILKHNVDINDLLYRTLSLKEINSQSEYLMCTRKKKKMKIEVDQSK